MSASEKVNESVLLSEGGIIQEDGQPSKPILGYTVSTLYIKDVGLQAIKGNMTMQETAELLEDYDPRLARMLRGRVEKYTTVLKATRSIEGKYVETMTTQKGRFVVKGDPQAKEGIMAKLGGMFGMGGGGGGGGGGGPSAV